MANTELRVERIRGPDRCPLCRESFASDDEVYTCAGCLTRYHRACSRELGGCATLGCPERAPMTSAEQDAGGSSTGTTTRESSGEAYAGLVGGGGCMLIIAGLLLLAVVWGTWRSGERVPGWAVPLGIAGLALGTALLGLQTQANRALARRRGY